MKFLFLFFFLFCCASENTKFAIPLNQNIDSINKNPIDNDYNQVFKPSYNENKASVNLLDNKSLEKQQLQNDSIEIEKVFVPKDQKYIYEKNLIKPPEELKKEQKSLIDNQKSVPIINEKIVQKVKAQSTKALNEVCYIQFGVFSDKNNAERLKNKILSKYPTLSLEITVKNNQSLLKTKGFRNLQECYSEVSKMNKDFSDIFVVNSGN